MRLKFDHTTKWYMLKLESVLENVTHEISLGFWDTNKSPNPGQKTRPNDNKQRKKENPPNSRPYRPGGQQSENRILKKDLTRELEKFWNMKWRWYQNNWCARNGPQRLGKDTGRARNRRTNRDHPNYSITKIEYWEAFWRPEETYCHSGSSERPTIS